MLRQPARAPHNNSTNITSVLKQAPAKNGGLFFLEKMMSQRLFIAVDLSPEIADEVELFERAFARYDLDIRWVKKDNLHLTLKFLGQTEVSRIAAITEKLSAVAAVTDIFAVHLAELGVFPDPVHPQVLWIGADQGAPELHDLAKQIEESLVVAGFPEGEKPFVPHLTIGRFKSNRNMDNFRVAMEEISYRSTYTLRVDHLSVYRSFLTPEGPQYESLFRADFS